MFTGLVMAGRRPASDAFANVWGEQHRALIDVNGVPMLLRVVRALRAAENVGRILVSIDEPAALEAVPELRRLVADGALTLHASLATPSRSVLDVLEGPADGEPVLAVTADHALLSSEMVDAFAQAAAAESADVLVGLVAESLVRSRFPDATRTYLRLRGGGYKGANLFAFQTREARRAAAFWVRAERFRKRPWRLVGALGPTALLLFGLGRLDLDAAFDRLSRGAGARIRPIPLPYPEAAIDVDRPADLDLVCRILAEGESLDGNQK
jgi:GTP:adenosylcobinamide-phosphate guanylyltransferase